MVSILIVYGAYYKTVHSHDPGGFSRRNPKSMHAHQHEWPEGCRDPKKMLQSPINLTTTGLSEKKYSSLELIKLTAQPDFLGVGHIFQVRYPATAPGARAKFEGSTYDLRQFHFHKPSEHLLDGKQYEMEAHFVFLNANKNTTPKALVLGVLILDGPFNKELGKIWKYLPPYREGYGETESEIMDWKTASGIKELELEALTHHEKILAKNLNFDLSGILPFKSEFIVYEGSLTTPSCDEGITHALSLSPIHMEHEQVEHFEGYYEGINRDIQPIGDLKARNFRRASTGS